MNPEDLAARLRDIRDIDPVSAWPPGPGWWIMGALAVALIFLLLRYRPSPPRLAQLKDLSWRRAAARELRQLRLRTRTEDSKKIADEFAELLRRIAIARCGRESCAGLAGNTWLEWLRDNDPNRFDWPQHGQVLAFATYAPALPAEASAQLGNLIEAAVAWTKPHKSECPYRPVSAD